MRGRPPASMDSQLCGDTSFRAELRKAIELPPAAARELADGMRAFHVELKAIRQDQVAGHQPYAPKQHHTGLTGAKEMLPHMRDGA